MKKTISFLLAVILMGTVFNFEVFANDTIVNNTTEDLIYEDIEGNLILAKIRVEENKTIVDYYINNIIDHTAIIDTDKDLVSVEHYKKRTGIEYFKMTDFVKEVSKDTNINNFQENSNSNSLNLENYSYAPLGFDEEPPSTPAGYNFVTSTYNSYFDARGYLYGNVVGEVSRYSTKIINFNKGTAAGVVIAAVTVFIGGAITLPILLKAIGASIIADAITSYINSKVWFSDIKTLYKGYCRKVLTLDTYQTNKHLLVYNYLTKKEETFYSGFKSGYKGTPAAIANGAVINYFN